MNQQSTAKGERPSSNKNRYSRYYTYIEPLIKHPIVKSVAPYVFSLFTVAFFAVFVIRPTVITILSLNKNIEESKQVLMILTNKSQNLALGRQNLNSFEPSLKAKMESLLPDKPSVASIIKSLQSPSESSASTPITQIQPLTLFESKQAAPTTNLGEVSFNYSSQRSYTQLISFMGTFNKLPRLISIDSLSVSKQQTDTLTTLSISGRAYYLK